MRKAFIQQFASPPAACICSNDDAHMTGTKTVTATREDSDSDSYYGWITDNLLGEEKLFLGTKTITANPFEAPEQEQSTNFFL
jgi:hypothetical protein